MKHYFKIQQVLIKFYISASTCPFSSERRLIAFISKLTEVQGGLECSALEHKMAACAWCTELAFCFFSRISGLVPSEKVTGNLDTPSLLSPFSHSFPSPYMHLDPWTGFNACFKGVNALLCEKLAVNIFQTWLIYKYCICNVCILGFLFLYNHYLRLLEIMLL